MSFLAWNLTATVFLFLKNMFLALKVVKEQNRRKMCRQEKKIPKNKRNYIISQDFLMQGLKKYITDSSNKSVCNTTLIKKTHLFYACINFLNCFRFMIYQVTSCEEIGREQSFAFC